MNSEFTPDELERMLWAADLPQSDSARLRTLELARAQARRREGPLQFLLRRPAAATAAGIILAAFIAFTSPGQAVGGWAADLVDGDRGVDLDSIVNTDRVPNPDGNGNVVRVRDCPRYVADFYANVDPTSIPGSVPEPDTLLPHCPSPAELQEQLAAGQAANQ